MVTQASSTQNSLSGASTYAPTWHKGSEGKLTLTNEALIYQSNGKSESANRGSANSTSWNKVFKHQVSPANHPKFLLKIVLAEGAGKPLTFQLPSRPELERIRKDISNRLQGTRSQHVSLLSPTSPTHTAPSSSSTTWSGSKRRCPDGEESAAAAIGPTTATSYGVLDPTALAVTRSSLLAANPTLRAQHQYLVHESKTLKEEDFWLTHQDMLEEEYARISGLTRAGTSSLLQSHLQVLTGRVTLGVEEMRQIFILYPAVHKAYEEKVPLELSDEQFWRKYLESEYFHRDRGRMGAASRRQDATSGGTNGQKGNNGNGKNVKADQQEARAAAVGTDDLFSRYDQKLRISGQLDDGVFGTSGGSGGEGASSGSRHKKWGTRLAVGQFDLASTFETERGNLLEGPKDNHPADPSDDGKGAKVIQKYNRHWAMVLNPEDAVAGSNLMEVARRSVEDVIPDDDDAKAGGGVDDEMQRLCGFANSDTVEANHALGLGQSDEYETLVLNNIEAYYSGLKSTGPMTVGTNDETRRRDNLTHANSMVAKIKALVSAEDDSTTARTIDEAFPPPSHGKAVLGHLTKRIKEDSKTDADTLEVVNSLPDEFKKRLHSYFRRSSELLRHFFGLRRLTESSNENGAYNQKLQKIVTGMENVYREMDEMRKEQKETNAGQIMGKMWLQVMNQLDWAFKLHREGTGSGGGGGFVTIEEF
jgi:transcription initiation factor TFIIH subunit 1